MVHITVERTIDAPPDEVFAWLGDSSNYTASPMVLREKRTRDGKGAPYGVGAERVILGVGAWFREVITSYDAPHEFSYLIVRSVPPIRHDGGSLHITARGAGSHVRWDTSYTHPAASGGPVLGRVTEPLLRFAFNGILKACDEQLSRSVGHRA